MKFEKVSIVSFGYELPPFVLTSEAIEDRLAIVYERLKLSPGRLELMTGIKERRFWPDGTTPSQVAALAGAKAIEKAPVLRDRIGCLIHASVCRDFLEPATANVVHDMLQLPNEAAVFDVSNACLGVLNGMLIVANMIELGQIEAGLVVSGEIGKPLLDSTISALIADPAVTRQSIKGSFASLTIGSAAVAVLLARRELAEGAGHQLLGGTIRAATEHHRLCLGGAVEPASSSQGALPSGGGATKDSGIATGAAIGMNTDAEALLHAGLDLAHENWTHFRREVSTPPDRVMTHQVGKAHHKLLFERLELPLEAGYVTFDRLGNVGSASLPVTAALAEESGFIRPGHRVDLLGIGSGLSSIMLGVAW